MTRDIIAVQCVGGYRLRLTFEGGDEAKCEALVAVPYNQARGVSVCRQPV